MSAFYNEWERYGNAINAPLAATFIRAVMS